MFRRETELRYPDSFPFPFKPYAIQSEFMQGLYDVIERGEIGIFESPTGTGKSLSLTCGSLKWLLDHEEAIKGELKRKQIEIQNAVEERGRAEGERDWLNVQFEAIGLKEELLKLKKVYEYIQKHDRKMLELRRNVQRHKNRLSVILNKKVPPGDSPSEEVKGERTGDSDLELNDCDSSDDEDTIASQGTEPELYKDTKIFFCSRTHSQLSQVVNEIKGTAYGKQIRITSLASRQNYCINDDVRGTGSLSLLNERCLDLQKGSATSSKVDEDGNTTKKAKRRESKCCSYYNKTNIDQLKDVILSQVCDIEELVTLGRRDRACPYYASRLATIDAQIVLLPYQMLFHKSTREQSGIDIRNSVIIVDEAHNLMDTISAIYSTELTLHQLKSAQKQVNLYKSKFATRFKASNLLKINQIEFIIKQLLRILSQSDVSHKMTPSYDLMAEGEFFNLDIIKLLKFCDESRFAQKVHELAQREANAIQPVPQAVPAKSLLMQMEEKMKRGPKVKEKEEVKPEEIPHKKVFEPQALRPFLAFLQSLTADSADGRVLIQYGVRLKYLLLNCGPHFSEILRDCRSIIVAGGTMHPINELTEQLFASEKSRIRSFTFDHVVSNESILPLVIQKGPSGQRFLFNYSTKMNKDLISDLGMCLLNICQLVPAGIVIFFGSYEYLNVVHNQLEHAGILARMQLKKDVYVEPKQSGQTEKILSDYSHSIRRGVKRGALLFSVVGGKLSEGLNFSDDLGRCVIVVGMPYPNQTSPELMEKMKYLDGTLKKAGAGSDYYENLCMKAVNQCIGRAVRHISDYASILLLDERYTQPRINQKLPSWIRDCVRTANDFSAVPHQLVQFFKKWKQQQQSSTTSSLE